MYVKSLLTLLFIFGVCKIANAQNAKANLAANEARLSNLNKLIEEHKAKLNDFSAKRDKAIIEIDADKRRLENVAFVEGKMASLRIKKSPGDLCSELKVVPKEINDRVSRAVKSDGSKLGKPLDGRYPAFMEELRSIKEEVEKKLPKGLTCGELVKLIEN